LGILGGKKKSKQPGCGVGYFRKNIIPVLAPGMDGASLHTKLSYQDGPVIGGVSTEFFGYYEAGIYNTSIGME
jgi:hypothetical protein